MIKLICGSMFSGKSTNLMRYMEKFVYARMNILFIRPEMDNRGYITHQMNDDRINKYIDEKKIHILYLKEFNKDIVDKILNCDYSVIFIDEYFMIKNNRLLLESTLKSKSKIDVYMAGLIADSEAQLFNETIQVLPLCDDIEKVNGVCTQCGSMLGNYSYFKGNKKEQIKVGDTEYECLCGKCFLKNKSSV